MVPLEANYAGWNQRGSDESEQIEPYRRYYFVSEGKNTEKWYFEKLKELRSQLGINALIHVDYLNKSGKHENMSEPSQIIKLAKLEIEENPKLIFEKNLDKIIIVFDGDVFESKKSDYDSVLKLANEYDFIPAVTNPSFELFLLLHRENAYREIIEPNAKEILGNKWVGQNTTKKRFVTHLFTKYFVMNPKKNSKIGDLAADVRTAIKEEREINNDITCCKGRLTSNIGLIIEGILNDNPSVL